MCIRDRTNQVMWQVSVVRRGDGSQLSSIGLWRSDPPSDLGRISSCGRIFGMARTKLRVLVLAAGMGLCSLTAMPAARAQDNTTPNTSQNVNTKRVTLNLENADVRYALKLLFQSVGVNYT